MQCQTPEIFFGDSPGGRIPFGKSKRKNESYTRGVKKESEEFDTPPLESLGRFQE
jgi:hypothetical protein